MEKKEVAVYLYLGVLIVASLLAVYFFNLQLTGFAVSSDLSLGEGNNVEYNGAARVLISNQTSGNYTSEIFGDGSNITWNNLTWQGNVAENSSLLFEVSDCLEFNCSDANFVGVGSDNIIDLNGLNLTRPYFVYRVLFSMDDLNVSSPSLESVAIDYSAQASEPTVPSVSVLITDPTGTKTSRSNIPLNFVSKGDNLTCWYNVRNSDGEVIANTTLSGCSNSTFTVIKDGDYNVHIYANGSLGFASQNSAFLVSVPVEKPKEKPKEPLPPPVPAAAPSITDLSLQALETSTLNPSSLSNFNLVATNPGDIALTMCKLSAGGEVASWFSTSEETQNLNAGEIKNFAFTLTVPEDAVEGNYAFPLTVDCTQIMKNSEFSVEVMKKRVDFNITDVQRTRQDRVVVSYDLKELLNEEQTVQLQFFLYDESNAEVANASANQTLLAGESDDFNTNIAINESLGENMTLTLSANVNAQQYSVSVKKPITLTAPTGFFVLGDNLGTTGNVLAIVILLVGVIAIFFFLKRKKISKKVDAQ